MSRDLTGKLLTPEQTVLTDVGPCLHDGGVIYRVWALGHTRAVVHIERPGRWNDTLALEPAKDSGYFYGVDPRGGAGDCYRIAIGGREPLPDFASHYQPQGAFGPSMVVDAAAYAWQARDWVRPAWNGQVVYECHVGTFTPQGTYRAAIGKLDELVALGVTALELMPLAEFAGARNWGYDGVLPFAPTHNYGAPDDLRALIDACHQRGLAVILDVVFNHLGPEGNVSHAYSDFYFHQGKGNPWGQNFNLDGSNSEPVRALLRQNIRYWLDEFRFDGFRMDATHAIHDESRVPLLVEIAELVHARGGFIIAEDDRNQRTLLEPRAKGGWGFDAVWADDFHHVARVSQTGEQEGFLKMFHGTPEEIAETIRRGWYYTGQVSPFHGKPRGTRADDVPPQSFVYCISNHDQVGNRWRGARLHEVIDAAGYRALSLFLCLVPQTPLLFMGQEWAATAPFHYFTDMSLELGAKIVEGRGREFLELGFVKDAAQLREMPSPQEEPTFLASKLDWSERDQPGHAGVLALYRAGLALRRELFGRANPARERWRVDSDAGGVTLRYHLGPRRVIVRLQLKRGAESAAIHGTVLLRSNAPEFAGAGVTHGPETLVTEES
ncbi:MAG: malto-oligosyltrehalose trehalohydrolase [Verrucomicrobiota bacterium]